MGEPLNDLGSVWTVYTIFYLGPLAAGSGNTAYLSIQYQTGLGAYAFDENSRDRRERHLHPVYAQPCWADGGVLNSRW